MFVHRLFSARYLHRMLPLIAIAMSLQFARASPAAAAVGASEFNIQTTVLASNLVFRPPIPAIRPFASTATW